MEFKLNQIDTEIRQKIKDTASEGKVHTKQGIAIGKNDREDKHSNNFNTELKKYNNSKKKLMISASKKNEVQVDAFMDNNDEKNVFPSSGTLLDIRK